VRDRPSRWALLLRRQRRRLRPALWGLAGFVIVLAALSLAHGVGHDSIAGWRERLGRTMGMPVRAIVIEGRGNTPEPMLRAALGVTRGEPILGFSVAAAQRRIESLSWVEHATVERRLPDTIVVSLQERRPFAVWQHDGKFVLIDRNGQTVADQDLAAFGTLPLVVGVGAPEHAAELLDALRKQPALQSRVVAAIRVGQRRWNLQLASGTNVLLPEGATAQAIAKLAELQASHQLLDRPLAVVDLRLPDRLVIRPREAKATDPHGDAAPPGSGDRRQQT